MVWWGMPPARGACPILCGLSGGIGDCLSAWCCSAVSVDRALLALGLGAAIICSSPSVQALPAAVAAPSGGGVVCGGGGAGAGAQCVELPFLCAGEAGAPEAAAKGQGQLRWLRRWLYAQRCEWVERHCPGCTAILRLAGPHFCVGLCTFKLLPLLFATWHSTVA